jgi:hypothetical protein
VLEKDCAASKCPFLVTNQIKMMFRLLPLFLAALAIGQFNIQKDSSIDALFPPGPISYFGSKVFRIYWNDLDDSASRLQLDNLNTFLEMQVVDTWVMNSRERFASLHLIYH